MTRVERLLWALFIVSALCMVVGAVGHALFDPVVVIHMEQP